MVYIQEINKIVRELLINVNIFLKQLKEKIFRKLLQEILIYFLKQKALEY